MVEDSSQTPDVSPSTVVTPITTYAAGAASQVMEAQRLAPLERIQVSVGLPMGPPGVPGPIGPTGPTGPSTKWHVQPLPPGDMPPLNPTPPQENFEVGEVWFDPVTGKVFVYEANANNILGWVQKGNIFGPTGPTGPTGPKPLFEVIPTITVGPDEKANVTVTEKPGTSGTWDLGFSVPMGATGPVGPAIQVAIDEIEVLEPGESPTSHLTQSDKTITLHFGFPPGPTGPPGTNIILKGSVNHAGPPTAPEAPNPQDGDGWLDSEGFVWVWSSASNGYFNAGKISGPTGPTGPGLRTRVFDLTLSATGQGTKVGTFTGRRGNYPFVRILAPIATGSPIYTDAIEAQVFYLDADDDNVQVVVDDSYSNNVVRVVVLSAIS